MNHSPQAELLIIFICLLAAVAGLAWGLMAHPLRIAPKASRSFFFSNSLLAIGIFVLVHPIPQLSWLNIWLSDLLFIGSFLLLGWGIRQLFKLKLHREADLILLLG